MLQGVADPCASVRSFPFVFCVFPFCVLAEELDSCPVELSLVVTSLFLHFCPEDAQN